MWYYIKWTFWLVIVVIVGSFLHYTLPRNDVVRIVDTEVRRIDYGENSIFWADSNTGEATGIPSRDVHFINAKKSSGKDMVYRNEDTGWGWPPYFKFNTSNLHTRATDMRSTQENPKWVAIKRYGWRNQYFSIYPNAISVKPVEGPDVRIIPWVSISILFVLGCLWLAIWSRWRKFRANRIDPLLDGE
ncbi:DUF1523 family protein [Tropicimonas sediminicola]|uniref:DUF1523 domain-containing protein n=1 Tax=Tropicimonas sediminicola TaxID=1031541 RepID=A0A239CIZ5_9RHOB|nr:DUF1523 family protein [Tropicimonas sediminicola]SNS19671.1 Protein of unknown function [Tropicimonas sediminicola]